VYIIAMTIKRWLPTFLAFPIGGYLSWVTLGSLTDPVTAAAGGLVAGAVTGAAQAFALGIGRRWAVLTAAAMSVGTTLGAVATGAGTELAELMLSGLIAGAAVGAAQSTLLAATRRVAAAWTAVTAASWSVAWLVSWAVIGINADQGFYVFGSSGALVATVLTGLALRNLTGVKQVAA
jgi:hypothetical protein